MATVGGRIVCTKEDPWRPEMGTPVEHPDAVNDDERDFGGGEYCVHYRCPNCGREFWVELPQ